MVFNDTDGLYTYTFEAEKKVNNDNKLTIIIIITRVPLSWLDIMKLEKLIEII